MISGKEPLNVGIMSCAHPRALSYVKCFTSLEFVRFAGIADDDKERGSSFAERYGVQYFSSYDELLKVVDVAVICAETAKRRDLVVGASNLGRHVLCEVPFATDIDGVREAVDVCKNAGVNLQPAFPCRFSPAAKQAQDYVTSGKIGRVLAMKGAYRSKYPGGWFSEKSLSGGGAVMHNTPHAVDLMRWINGAEPAEVYAEIDGLMIPGDCDDSAIVSVKFSNGAFATIDTSWSRPKSYPTPTDASLVVVGTEGSVRLDLYGGQKMDVYCGESDKHDWVSWGDNLDLLMLRSFVESIVNDTSPVVTGDDCIAAFTATIAAYESAKKKEPIKL